MVHAQWGRFLSVPPGALVNPAKSAACTATTSQSAINASKITFTSTQAPLLVTIAGCTVRLVLIALIAQSAIRIISWTTIAA